MSDAVPVFRLTNPEGGSVTARKPDAWRAALERGTRAHRARRAREIAEAHDWRAVEAEWVRHALLEGVREESVPVAGGLDPFRPLAVGLVRWMPVRHPDAHPDLWISCILLQWDRERAQASRGARRLLRGEWESVDNWRGRVLAEATRRVDSAWHASRARGQIERFARVARCGDTIRGYLTCTECRTRARPEPIRERCDSVMLCAACRARRASRYRAQFIRSRRAAVQAVRRARSGAGQCRDPLTEKFLTLTAPHIPIERGGPELQAQIVRAAWRPFMNALRNHWRGRRSFKLTRYVRCLEATEGSGDAGHTHIHAWVLGPFVRDAVIAALWARALIAAGFPAELWPESAWRDKSDLIAYLEARGDARALRWARHTLPKRFRYPIVQMQRVRPHPRNARTEAGDDLAAELIKYLTKDLESDGRGGLRPIHPEVFAAIYRGLDGGRMLTAARGFWVVLQLCCTDCGCVGTLRPVADPGTDEGLARGPPTLELGPWS